MQRDRMVRRGATLVTILTIAILVLVACGGTDEEAEQTGGAQTAGVANLPTLAPFATPFSASGQQAALPSTQPAQQPETPSGAASAPPPTAPASGGGSTNALISQGEQLFNQLPCMSCHSVSGQQKVGPALNGLYGSKVQLASGKSVTADEDYLQEAILKPDSQIVDGFPSGVMAPAVAPFEDQIQQDDNLDALIAYIKSLK